MATTFSVATPLMASAINVLFHINLDRNAVRGYRKQIKNCPYEKDSHRSEMKDVLKRLEAMNPEARFSLWSSMNNVQADLLPVEVGEQEKE